VIEVTDWLVNNSPELHIEIAGCTSPCSSGLQLGVRYVGDAATDMIVDYLPEAHVMQRTRNLADFVRILVLDRSTGNADGRRVIFTRPAQARKFKAVFIDQGFCFNAGQSDFPEFPLRGVYCRNSVYERVTGWELFEPVLSRAEQIECSDLWIRSRLS